MASAQLVPCPNCSRHVRLAVSHCPFCNSELDATALSAKFEPRRVGVQAGVKRALVFAMGATVAAACGDEPDPTGVPVYGAPVAPTTEEVSTDEGASTVSTSASEPDPSPDLGMTSGAPAGQNSGTGLPVDAGSLDAGPHYDSGADAGLTEVGLVDAGVDAGVSPDASAPASEGDVTWEPSNVATYGAPPIQN